LATEPALRVIMRRLREIMAEPGDGQARLDKIVRQIAGVMVAEVCSIYLKRRDGALELYATEGLKREAVHSTRLNRNEGLVGRCAEQEKPVNEPDAQAHPAFSYRPETGEEAYHSMLAVPVLRSGTVVGVLVVQNHTRREYAEEDVEVLQATAMVVAELVASGGVAGSEAEIEVSRATSSVIVGQALADGVALGHAVLHEPRIVVTTLLAEDPATELKRLEDALQRLRAGIDEMFAHERLSAAGEHRDVLEAYRMFAHDRGWHHRLRGAVQDGLTAEAAVERVQNSTRARMLRQIDPFWNERVRDLDDLSDRLLRILSGRANVHGHREDLPDDTILIARTMGPAELLDYDRTKLRGLIVEDSGTQSHVAIVAKALGIPAIGKAHRIVEHAADGDAVIVDSETGEVHLRPSGDVIATYQDKVRFRAKRQQRFRDERGLPSVTRDGQHIELLLNAGMLVDLPHLEESGAEGIGLFRTEFQFMLSEKLPRLDRQTEAYRIVLEQAKGLPVVFRTLDIGGDKFLPYLERVPEENPAMGWRALRMSLDHPALFRTQIRALFRAHNGREMSVMVPMLTAASEMDAVRALIDKEVEHAKRHGHPLPVSLSIGAMLEVPSLLFELDSVLQKTDFISVGSNDLLQFFFAADRTSADLSSRYDAFLHAPMRALRIIIEAGERHGVPVTVCGEIAGQPLKAMALIGLGCRSLSMAASNVGPVKAMVRSLPMALLQSRLGKWIDDSACNIQEMLAGFAKDNDVEV
jgi:phosphotransferase system, enzyme I, PtsP